MPRFIEHNGKCVDLDKVQDFYKYQEVYIMFDFGKENEIGFHYTSTTARDDAYNRIVAMVRADKV